MFFAENREINPQRTKLVSIPHKAPPPLIRDAALVLLPKCYSNAALPSATQPVMGFRAMFIQAISLIKPTTKARLEGLFSYHQFGSFPLEGDRETSTALYRLQTRARREQQNSQLRDGGTLTRRTMPGTISRTITRTRKHAIAVTLQRNDTGYDTRSSQARDRLKVSEGRYRRFLFECQTKRV